MADLTFHIEIITPEKVLVSENIDYFEASGIDGDFQILAEHTPFLTGLSIGQLIFSKTGKKTYVSISGGFCEVMPQKTVILAHTAELSYELDKTRAEEARDRAQKRLELPEDSSVDTERANAALLRALNRLKVAGMK